MSAFAPPPIRTPICDQHGILAAPWLQWFRGLYTRTGGALSESNNSLEYALFQQPSAVDVQIAEQFDQTPASYEQQAMIDMETRYYALAEELADLRTQINDLRQGLTL